MNKKRNQLLLLCQKPVNTSYKFNSLHDGRISCSISLFKQIGKEVLVTPLCLIRNIDTKFGFNCKQKKIKNYVNFNANQLSDPATKFSPKSHLIKTVCSGAI